MKPVLLLFSFLALFPALKAQDIYAVTDANQGGISWGILKKVSLQKAQPAYQSLLSNASFQKTENQTVSSGNVAALSHNVQAGQLPMHNGVAAIAVDRNQNRIYYSTMFGGEMHVFDPVSNQLQDLGNIYDEAASKGNPIAISPQNQGPVITRMAQGADDYIYGLSNDGARFFRISTHAGKPVIEHLGGLINHPANEGMDVQASCTSWGGDMVAGADGNLYLFSMYQHAFKIDPSSRVATYLGKVSGLPDGFTLNGAAVLEDGRLMLSSAAVFGKYALIRDMKTLEATMTEAAEWFNTSDLASTHLLFSKGNNYIGIGDEKIKFMAAVFPNPVRNGEVVVHFKSGQTGRYALDLLDMAGAPKLQSQVNLSGEAQRVTLKTASFAKGMYLLRVINPNDKQVQTIKVLLQ